ncbi:WD repeat-containing protein [Reticulomyxa filosa]|uniref:WD repeat-containing protein n=1 Tax=Reticulomyxa filosa TaxID=46433 RepID=X6LLZ0_RETFI|nr:WD repeat-containing protein [Reticulomyxa filosa]|eukprot:ETO02644.1 WD repeat-containing protein [Reticulomyxa filosa]
MLLIDAKTRGEEKEAKKTTFSLSGCYNKEWISLTNELQSLNAFVCCLCNQIANNAVELQCDKHENAERVYLVGEECLQTYLKQNNGKCPIDQHEHCEYSKKLLVICPRYYDLNICLQSNEGIKPGEKGEIEKNHCDYKGKIKDVKDHLNKSCQLISIQQNDSSNIQSQLNTMREQIDQVQNTVKELQSQLQKEKLQIEKLKESDNEKNKQLEQLNEEIKQLKLENERLKLDRELNEKKQSGNVSKLVDDNLILKQQPLQTNDSEDRKEEDNDKLLKFKSEQYSTFNFELFRVTSKLLKTLSGHTNRVWSIDYSTFDDSPCICSGSQDKTVRVWNVETAEQIQLFKGHEDDVYCVRFSQYHYYNHHHNVICSASYDKTICFWDFKNNRQIRIFNEHTDGVAGIEFSAFTGGRYLCSGSYDKTIRLWDIETSKSLHVFNGHTNAVLCVAFSHLQSYNNNNTKSNGVGVIGGNGYTICSGSGDTTIRIWDIETTKQLIVFKGHEHYVNSVKYGLHESGLIGGANTLLSGSNDFSVRLWDIRSKKQIQVFNGHNNLVMAVEYSPYMNCSNIGGGNVICSGSADNTIRFWDIRSNKKELHMIKGDDKEDDKILCLRFLSLRKKQTDDDDSLNLCYGSGKGPIRFWGQIVSDNFFECI